MKRTALIVGAALGLALAGGKAQASWSALCYSGYQHPLNIFAKRYKCLTPEEERLQKFWHDYYSALNNYYCDLQHIDWVAYYKNHGYQINAGCGGCAPCGRVNYAPVFVTPSMTWAVPYGAMGGPPAPGMGAGVCGPAGCGPMGPMGGPVGPVMGYGAPEMPLPAPQTVPVSNLSGGH
jgi:hypothetical protein